jgi:hypothetical protein
MQDIPGSELNDMASGKAKIGDIIEIPISDGLVYAHYTHQHSPFGGLIRVFDPVFNSPVTDLDKLVEEPVRFSTFLPVQAFVKRGIFKVIGNREPSAKNRIFPIFRDGIADPNTKRVATWWLWDGEKEWKVGTLTPEQRKYPLRAVWNDTMLVNRIEQGWTPEKDLR